MRRQVGIVVGKEASPEFRKFVVSCVQQTVEVVSEDKAEQASIVMCALAVPPYFFSDDVFTACVDCKVGIRHRPAAPKKPPKVCIRCACVRIRNYQNGETQNGDT